MKIVVCVKQVPATNEAKIDPETKRILREDVKAILNPFDHYAIEEAIRLRNQLGGEVIALSMGPEKAVRVLREAISMGADHAILLNDRAFGGSDTWATSYALAKAISKIGQVDLVLCGKQAIDGDTAQVGPGIAAHLDWLQATYVTGINILNTHQMKVKRLNEMGYDICLINTPAVLSVVKGINTPRVPTLKGRIASEHYKIPVWTPTDLDADIGLLGLNGSPTRVVKTQPPAPRESITKKFEGTPQMCAQSLVKELRLHNLL
jgi:electron transfer flavoprotein beta subunit